MDIVEYEAITGIAVPASQQARLLAALTKSQRILETLLGYTLDTELVDANEYVEIGQTASDCPCGEVDEDNLEPPDPVVFAYRLFPYNELDTFIAIDPATAIHKVKLVKDGITYKTFEPGEFRADFKQGLIRFLERCDECTGCDAECGCTQIAVDADWVWESDIPDELLQVWAEMGTYYGDPKNGLRSESLGPHSYTKFDNTLPQNESYNMSVIRKYAGPNGSFTVTITV